MEGGRGDEHYEQQRMKAKLQSYTDLQRWLNRARTLLMQKAADLFQAHMLGNRKLP